MQDCSQRPPLPERSTHLSRSIVPPPVPRKNLISSKLDEKVFDENYQLSAKRVVPLKHDNRSVVIASKSENKFNCSVVNILHNNSDKLSVDKGPSAGSIQIWTTEAARKNMHQLRGQRSTVSSFFKTISLSKRNLKKLILFLLIGSVCFLLGAVIPFLIFKLERSGSKTEAIRSEGLNNPPVHISKSDLTGLENILSNLFISVKTTHHYHFPRVVILLETWVGLVKSQTWFFSDRVDSDMIDRTGGHIVATNCSDVHSRTALACKMGNEFDYFIKSHKGWWCHFDDDNYVHVTKLAQLLKSHSPELPVYLGKPSTAKPLEVFDIKAPQNTSHFWFATGGAGFCISRTLALKMAPYAADGKFVETGAQFWFPDDVTMGYIIEHLLGHELTVVPEFHSHLEPMKRLRLEELDDQITFSYLSYNGVDNVLDLPGPFSKDVDPTRFYSLHCLLYNAQYCPDEDNLRS